MDMGRKITEMDSSVIIGGADGPTSIFLAGNVGMQWISFGGLGIVVFMLIPNLIYAVKYRGVENLCKNRLMNILEQIGRYASMILMVFAIGIKEFGFYHINKFLIYWLGNIVLLLAYWIIWFFYMRNLKRAKKQRIWQGLALAIIPTFIFLLSGITLDYILLIISAVIFGCGHIYVTYQNLKKSKTESNNIE